MPQFVNAGSDNGKGGAPLGSLGMRVASPLAKTLQGDVHGAEAGIAFGSSDDTTGGDSSRGDSDGGLRGGARADARAHERVVNVPDETARWVFTNQPEPEDTITMQASYFTTPLTGAVPRLPRAHK